MNFNYHKKDIFYTLEEAKKKLEYFCAYQERCHEEVIKKLQAMKVPAEERDIIIVYLIDNDFLNEERFACSFARGKHRIKQWGKIRIVNELKIRKISQYNIKKALGEITEQEYIDTLESLIKKSTENIKESNSLKKQKKIVDFLFIKGYEYSLILDKIQEI